ncbi:DUF302 domain-containing protein [Nocardioides litoris]|uniref:DUF302 domain-containing protein n=1 Tax=Nocardioides litoris TaxID=1926648 RepID=UPI00111D531E|nr:DUF302 domain-containing protein [Nocardioides litoris]
MADYTLSISTTTPYDETVAAVRHQLAEAGFGVLTEIDLRATLKAKLDVDVVPQVILGACRPQLAHQALETEPSIAALLPCNVVVRAVDEHTTVVEAFDPAMMTSFVAEPSDTLRTVSEDARARLGSALAALADTHDDTRTDAGGQH